MDKPKNDNTIRIKLTEDKQRPLEEPSQMMQEIPSESTTRIIKIDQKKLESDPYLESAAAEESIDESFDWIIPESSDEDLEEFNLVSKKNTKKGGFSQLPSSSAGSKNKLKKTGGWTWGSIIVTAIFAILIGTTIGTGMLKLVITGSNEKETTTPPVVEETGAKEDTATEGKAGSATIPQLTTYVVQGGSFKSKEGAKETSTQLSAKGVPSQIVEIDGAQYIFIGVTDSIEDAKALGAYYNENGSKDPYAKPLLLDEKQVADLTAKEKTFIEAMPEIYQTLTLASSQAILNETISAEALAKIDGQLNENNVKNEKVKKLQAELLSANKEVKAFQTSKDEKNLNEAQQHLLNFLADYYSL